MLDKLRTYSRSAMEGYFVSGGFHKRLTFTLVLLFLLLQALPQADTVGFMLHAGLGDIKDQRPENNAEELVSVASLFESSAFEAPGVITVLTEEDIKASGAIDILDLLNQVPGFSIGADVQNGISIGVRGNWAEEAKLLVMLDGMPLNELSYGTYVLAQRVPLLNVKRIEIIRGSGSSRYGGTAALGVINILTKSGAQLSGHRLAGSTGVSGSKVSSANLAYNYGGIFPNGVEITTFGALRQGNMSNGRFTLYDTTDVNMADSSRITSSQLYLTIKYRGLKFKQFYEDYTFQSTHEPIFSLNRTTVTEAEKALEFKKFDLNLLINYKEQIPWNTLYGDPAAYDAQNLLAKRIWGGTTLKSKFSGPVQFLFGLSSYRDNVRHQRHGLKLSSGNTMENFEGYSGFLEGSLTSKYANVNAGARFEQYAYFKPNFAPRISVARLFKNFNYKLIYNRAYKLPALQNINLDESHVIKPERVREMQAQFGYNTKQLNLTATYFNICIMDLIVYGYNTVTRTESYINSGDVYNHGIDFEAAYRHEKIRFSGNYSFNSPINSTAPEVMCDTSDVKKGFLAFPRHKAVFKCSYTFNPKYSLSLNYIFESERGSVIGTDPNTEEPTKEMFPATHNLNLVVNVDGFVTKNANLRIGLHNLLNTKLYYLYPFDSGYAPVTGMGRELMLAFILKF